MLMNMFFIVLLFFYTTANANVKVSVYYETLCPDSVAFIKNQLFRNYRTFGDIFIQLELIPYGFAQEIDRNGTKTFTCQHGPNECFGNMIHGIVIASQPIGISAKFVYCSESSFPPTSALSLEKCSEQNGISWSDIKKIESSGKGADIMARNGKKTKELSPAFIPTIVFNDKFNQDDQDQATSDFKGVVCKYLDYKPKQCDSRRTDVKIIQI